MKRKTPAQRAAQRAIDYARKPPNISVRHGAARMKRRTTMVAQRLRKLDILPDIVEKIKEGWPDSEVARWIHQEGKLAEVSEDNLRLEIRRYRTQVMSPTDITARRLPEGVIEAAHMVRQATDELAELGREIEEHRDILVKTRRLLSKMLDTAEGNGDGKGGGGPDKAIADHVPNRAMEASGLAPLEIRAYLTLCGESMGNYVKLVDSQRKLALTSAQVKALLHVETGEDHMETSEVIEARVVEYTKRRFAGRQDAQKVLGNPDSRAKVMALFQRAITDPKLHGDLTAKSRERDDDIPAGTIIEVD